MKKIVMTTALAVVLASCSGGGPGKSDAEQALGQFFEQNAGVKPSFEDFKVGSCEKSESGPGYACSVTGTAEFALGSRKQREPLTGTFVFDRVGSEWKVVGTR
ncbi:hypothetical protein LDO32_03805 [Luteimonas sp. Y-2-2-4F]|nr:hypothetical protein [Luteimonas sp. Y-2-2-4F]MCD9030859.1 hypothetical protein [Luteimonas sp. Y-2-2-4F]